jgi:hypothetical protein
MNPLEYPQPSTQIRLTALAALPPTIALYVLLSVSGRLASSPMVYSLGNYLLMLVVAVEVLIVIWPAKRVAALLLLAWPVALLAGLAAGLVAGQWGIHYVNNNARAQLQRSLDFYSSGQRVGANSIEGLEQCVAAERLVTQCKVINQDDDLAIHRFVVRCGDGSSHNVFLARRSLGEFQATCTPPPGWRRQVAAVAGNH